MAPGITPSVPKAQNTALFLPQQKLQCGASSELVLLCRPALVCHNSAKVDYHGRQDIHKESCVYSVQNTQSINTFLQHKQMIPDTPDIGSHQTCQGCGLPRGVICKNVHVHDIMMRLLLTCFIKFDQNMTKNFLFASLCIQQEAWKVFMGPGLLKCRSYILFSCNQTHLLFNLYII